MAITRVVLENFTVFDKLDMEPSPGINVLVGANGTGKTHLLKVCYAACAVSKSRDFFVDKLINVFLPSGLQGEKTRRLTRRGTGKNNWATSIFSGESKLEILVYTDGLDLIFAEPESGYEWSTNPMESVYIPAKDMLANAPGFRSLYAAREVHFEETYLDILDKAYLPPLRNPAEFVSPNVLERLEVELGGKVTIHGEEFFLNSEQGEIEFTLLAEGLRKLGLLWLLIRNGTLKPGAVLFWDEPETNLNPKLYGVVIDVLLELQRIGVQVFLATHDYVILKELDLQALESDKVAFHSLYRSEETGEIECHTTDRFLQIQPNAIGEAFDSVYDREIKRAMAGLV